MFNNNYPYQNPYHGYMNHFQQPIQQIKTNKVWVISLEDAMARSVDPNSEYIYLHQDKPLLIEVKTDMQGKKTARVMELKDYIEQPKPENTIPNDFPTREEFDGLKAEIQAIKGKLSKDIVE